ncbi:hypothetical protein FACS1894139_11760 [Planctomycetales bacterium]|nr:hypothetical protein FACS1894108_05100 [Planctomycetales bacterium]GHT06283.1 hypothetical protein FACS1894139_11760 [Planctomycetales bacterium]
MPRYLDPKNDIPFKKIFGEHQDLMISFLNSLLPLPAGREIVELEYLSPELVPNNPFLKDSFVDVRCTDAQKRQFFVEMQMYWNQIFLQRMLYNTAKLYVRELETGDPYGALKPVYGLAILNDIMTDAEGGKEHTHWYHRYQMTEETHSQEKILGVDLTLIELPLFKPENVVERQMTRLWLRFLKEVRHDTDQVAPELLANEYTRSALRICEEGAYSPAEREAYENYWVAAWSRTAELHAGREEGRKEGLAEGLEKGREEGREEGRGEGEKQSALRIAERLKQKGFSPAEIAETTGLSLDEVQKWLS